MSNEARYREALERIAAKQPETLETLRANGIVLDDLTDKWQKVAFTIYSDLCEVDIWARQALEDA